MARLNQPPEKYGTFDGICVYHMNEDDFMRGASSLTGERVKTEPEFAVTMTYAKRLGYTSRLASAVYNMLPAWRRKHPFYRKLTGMAIRLLEEGRAEDEVVVQLLIAIRLPKRKPRKKTAGVITMRVAPRFQPAIIIPLWQPTPQTQTAKARSSPPLPG